MLQLLEQPSAFTLPPLMGCLSKVHRTNFGVLVNVRHGVRFFSEREDFLILDIHDLSFSITQAVARDLIQQLEGKLQLIRELEEVDKLPDEYWLHETGTDTLTGKDGETFSVTGDETPLKTPSDHLTPRKNVGKKQRRPAYQGRSSGRAS